MCVVVYLLFLAVVADAVRVSGKVEVAGFGCVLLEAIHSSFVIHVNTVQVEMKKTADVDGVVCVIWLLETRARLLQLPK